MIANTETVKDWNKCLQTQRHNLKILFLGILITNMTLFSLNLFLPTKIKFQENSE